MNNADPLATSHPFQVSIWVPEEPALKLLGKAHWDERARCSTDWRATDIAVLLRLHYKVVKISKLNAEGKFEPYAYLPSEEEAKRLTTQP